MNTPPSFCICEDAQDIYNCPLHRLDLCTCDEEADHICSHCHHAGLTPPEHSATDEVPVLSDETGNASTTEGLRDLYGSHLEDGGPSSSATSRSPGDQWELVSNSGLQHTNLVRGENSSHGDSGDEATSSGQQPPVRSKHKLRGDLLRPEGTTGTLRMEQQSTQPTTTQQHSGRDRESQSGQPRKEMDNYTQWKASSSFCWGYFRPTTFLLNVSRTKRGIRYTNGANTAPHGGKAGRTPDFVLADHTRDDFPHFHVLARGCTKEAARRALRRVGEYFRLDGVESHHLRTTMQHVHDPDNALFYLAKYGFDNIHYNGTVWDPLRMWLEAFPRSTRDDCLNAFQSRRQQDKDSRNGTLNDLRIYVQDSTTYAPAQKHI